MNSTVTMYFHAHSPFAFTANVSSPKTARTLEAQLSYRFRYDPSVEVRANTDTRECSPAEKEPNMVNWAREVGKWIPLHLDELEESSRSYSSMIRLEDPSYMKYFSDDLWMEPTDTDEGITGEWNIAKIDHANGGWLVSEFGYQNAQRFVRDMNQLHIPMSDTFEWNTFYDATNRRVLFFPLIPGRVGEPKLGDTFSPYGVWNDVLRAFVFGEDDWFSCMEFYGYTI